MTQSGHLNAFAGVMSVLDLAAPWARSRSHHIDARIPLGRDPFLCFQELDIHCMESSRCDSQIGGDVQPKSVNDDQKKGAIPTEGAEPVKRSGPKLVIRIDLERAGNGRRRGKRVRHP